MFIFCVKKRLLLSVPGVFLCLALLSLSACRNPIDTSALNYLAKTDTDMMADTSLREMNYLMEDLLRKLYERNPGELEKGRGVSIGQRQSQIFDTPYRLIYEELNYHQGTDALNLAFNPDYKGDRVFALMAGLVGMVRSAYNWQAEQFIFDSLDEQKFFNAARNIEVLALRLSSSRDASGELLLHSNNYTDKREDLSCERIFGKLIAIQDLMAFTAVGRWERGVNSVVMKVVFLPMGI